MFPRRRTYIMLVPFSARKGLHINAYVWFTARVQGQYRLIHDRTAPAVRSCIKPVLPVYECVRGAVNHLLHAWPKHSRKWRETFPTFSVSRVPTHLFSGKRRLWFWNSLFLYDIDGVVVRDWALRVGTGTESGMGSTTSSRTHSVRLVRRLLINASISMSRLHSPSEAAGSGGWNK